MDRCVSQGVQKRGVHHKNLSLFFHNFFKLSVVTGSKKKTSKKEWEKIGIGMDHMKI